MNAGVWSSPSFGGISLPPCAYFTLTSIDHNRALFFGGNQPGRGRINDHYLIDFDIMISIILHVASYNIIFVVKPLKEHMK
jgi:hypothetical protein